MSMPVNLPPIQTQPLTLKKGNPQMTVEYLAIASTLPKVLMLAAFSVGTFLTVASSDNLEKVLGLAVLDALESIRLTVKEAAPIMRLDESNLRSMLRGDGKYHLGVVHLARLPFSFWLCFGPMLFALMARQNLTALAEDIGLRKSA